MIEFETEILEVISRAPGVKSFRFKTKEGADFKPGQFFFVTIKIDGKDRTKHFSFSNSPTESDYIEFTKRITESDFSRALDKLAPGDWAKLKLPHGSFTFEGEYPKIAFLSGGIGITPIRSICKFATDKKLAADMILFYGNNKEEDIIFREDFDRMRMENPNLRIVHTLTFSDIDKDSWSGRRGYIDDKMIREEASDYRERVFYICGPPRMVDALTDTLKNKLNLPQDKIRLENFAGY